MTSECLLTPAQHCPHPHSVLTAHTWGVAELSHRSQSPPLSYRHVTSPSAWGLQPDKNKPATFLGSPLPLPALQPSIRTAESAREGRERDDGVEEASVAAVQPREEREREREKEGEGREERERSPYMGTCADNMWQWLRGQQRSDTRQMEEIKHGTERVPGP